ncbi:MAG: 8-oxo-dGTP diphosphatase [Desulfobulbaceae bacterium]|jgi:8-oxo-dGTP diphosphatase|nr:8-oxo-dGTP diphosphatase [Desulfobulbaceae bacterium]
MYTPIIGTLGFILSPDQEQVLLIHRQGRKNDHHVGKFNGLGGKMEPGESVSQCMEREIHEEAGIRCTAMSLRGTINWTDFGPQGEDWLGFIFLVHTFSGTPNRVNAEGKLEWHTIKELGGLPMWPGDRHFLPLIFDKDPRIFHGVMPYKNGQPVRWDFQRF